MNGDFFPLKLAFSEYMNRWYSGLYPDTNAVREFVERGSARSVVWAPDRMVDQIEDMLKAYQKNSNTVEPGDVSPGKNALFPIVVMSMARDYTPTGADMGGRQVGRRLVQLVEGGSVYGYRQAMGDIRVQVVIMAAESASARSLAAQFSLFVGEIPNRRFKVKHTFGQYTLEMPCLLESPDILFASVASEYPNMTILAADLTLKASIPYVDAPKAGEPNDGTTNNPPGYPMVANVVSLDENVLVQADTTADGTEWSSHDPSD